MWTFPLVCTCAELSGVHLTWTRLVSETLERAACSRCRDRIVSNTRSRAESVPPTRGASLAGRRRRVQFRVSVRVQVSTLHGVLIPVDILPTRAQRSWPPSLTLGWSWRTGLPHVNLPRTGDRRLSMPVLRPGTFCLTVSRTLILLCKPLSAILRRSFLYTNTLSAIEVSFKRRHINPLLFIITKTGKIASSRFTFFLLKQKIRCLTEFAAVAIVEHRLPSVHKIHHHVVSCPHWAVSSYLDVETLAPVLVYTTTKYKITHRCI